MRRSALVLVCALTGCFPDFSGFTVVRAADAGRVPPGTDGGPPRPEGDAGRPGRRFGGPCARPTLFVVARSIGDTPTLVLRYELHGTAGIVECGAAAADSALSGESFSVAAVDDRFVLVGARNGVDGVDPIDDRLLFHLERPGMHPNDAFAVADTLRGDRAAVVAWSRTGSGSRTRGNIVEMVVYSAEGAERNTWQSGDFLLGSTVAVAASRRNPSEALAVNPSNFSAAELDLFGQVRRDPPLLGAVERTLLETLHAGRTNEGREMFVWTGLVDGDLGILAARDPYMDPMLNDLTGTTTCDPDRCDPVHAVVDPTMARAVIAVCRGPAGPTLTRFDFAASSCQHLVDASSFGELRPEYGSILE